MAMLPAVGTSRLDCRHIKQHVELIRILYSSAPLVTVDGIAIFIQILVQMVWDGGVNVNPEGSRVRVASESLA
jgi:hypothetical protein